MRVDVASVKAAIKAHLPAPHGLVVCTVGCVVVRVAGSVAFNLGVGGRHAVNDAPQQPQNWPFSDMCANAQSRSKKLHWGFTMVTTKRTQFFIVYDTFFLFQNI